MKLSMITYKVCIDSERTVPIVCVQVDSGDLADKLTKNFALFSFANTEITHRFQTAKSEVRALLLQFLLPWLENVELVAANVTPATPLSYIMVGFARHYVNHCKRKQNLFLMRAYVLSAQKHH